MRQVDALLEEYGVSHQNPTNKLIHWFCVPLIFFSTVGLVGSIPLGPLDGLVTGTGALYFNWATIILALTTVWYFRMSVPLALGMIGVAILMLYLCIVVQNVFPYPLWQTSLAIFVVAWIGQFIGHKIEGVKPSFFQDLQFLLVGPMWLMHFVFKKLGIQY
jgi:uncharacterized membrane protein YGL010W